MRKDLSHCTSSLIRRQINAKKIFYVDYIFNLLIFKVNSIHLHNFVMRRLMIIYAQHLFRKFIYKEVNRKINFHWNPCFTRFWAYIEGEFIPIYFLFSILSTTNYKNGKFFTTCCFTSSNIALRGIGKLWKICFDFATFEANCAHLRVDMFFLKICVLDLQTFPRKSRNTKLRYSLIFSLKTIAIRSVLEITTMWMMWGFCFEKKKVFFSVKREVLLLWKKTPLGNS